MILKVYETNNGYRCSCCSSGDSDYEWIEEFDALSFEEVLDKAYDFDNNIDGVITLRYEKDGKVLYGYETWFGNRHTEVFIHIGDSNYRIVADGCDKEYKTKSEILEIWQEEQSK